MAKTFFTHIESLRGLAVGLVIANHIELTGFEGGFIGVDIFFVISGYLITRILLGEGTNTGQPPTLRQFYARRARRILPAALVTAVTTLAVSALLFSPYRMQTIWQDFLWTIAQSLNIGFQLNGVDYFGRNWQTSPFQHYWSLGIEEQFYLIWPLLLLSLLALRRRPLIPILITLAIGSFAFMLWLAESDPRLTYLNLAARGWELAAGGILAAVQARRAKSASPTSPKPIRTIAALISLAALASIGASILIATEDNFATTLWMPVLATAALIAYGDSLNHWALLGNPIIKFVGRISYSLYLWHWPVIFVVDHFNPVPSASRALTMLAISFVLATLSWRFVEQPFLRNRKQPNPNPKPKLRTPIAFAAVATLIATVGLAPAFLRVPPAQAAPAPAVVDPLLGITDYQTALAAQQRLIATTLKQLANEPLNQTQHQYLAHLATTTINWGDPPDHPFWSCELIADTQAKACDNSPDVPNPSETWIIIGDSFAQMWTPALRKIAQATPQLEVIAYTRGQCNNSNDSGLFQNQDPALIRDCLEFHRLLPGLIAEREFASDQTVRVIFADVFDRAKLADRYLASSSEFMAQIEQAGKADQSHIISSKPFQLEPLACLNPSVDNAADCSRPLRKSPNRNPFKRNLAELTQAHYINVTKWFCDSTTCPIFIADIPVSRDGAHIGPYQAEAMATLFGLAIRSEDASGG